MQSFYRAHRNILAYGGRFPVARAAFSSSHCVNAFLSLLAMMFFTGGVYAQAPQLRLGNPVVLSALGSPLWVKIPIEATDAGTDLTASRFSLGLRPPNAPVPFVERAEIGLERQGNKYLLVIRSQNAIDEPAIGIVLREELPNGVRSREFFLLLDPAPLSVVLVADPNRTAATNDVTPTQPLQAPVSALPTSADNAPPARVSAAMQTQRATRKKTRRDRQTGVGSDADTATVRPATVPASRERISPITDKRRSAAKNRRAASVGRVDGGPLLKLSFGEGLDTRAATTEAERAELRARNFTLDMDDLTSGLLERQHRISQLEKELAGLALRVSAAERLIGAVPLVAQAPIAPAAVPATAEGSATSVATVPPAAISTAAPETRVPTPAPAVIAAKPVPGAPVISRSTSGWIWLLVALGLAAALAAAIWGIRYLARKRDGAYRLTGQRAEDYVAEVLAQQPLKKSVATIAPSPATAPDQAAARAPTPAPATVDTQADALPEIHFELPELLPEASVAMGYAPTTANEPERSAVTKIVRKPVDDAASRRMRYLQSRYNDIAILMPPLDAPQRLLRQAATVYDEGATDFAKRLLKFAAYSRPYTPEFWLALLELLYREKFASDYVVNAKWFHQHHAESPLWDEVVRIGYLLDPIEPLFAIASHWPHDEPVVGTWLPANPGEQKPVAAPPHLALELTK